MMDQDTLHLFMMDLIALVVAVGAIVRTILQDIRISENARYIRRIDAHLHAVDDEVQRVKNGTHE